ncbi:MAG TPA: nucleoside recognition domain-containing protein [Myxococcota bacterium]|nr:nucleoside recognition domain-containing protein [Myxococcota bacterium]
MNRIFVGMIALAFASAAWSQLTWEAPPAPPPVEVVVPGADHPDPAVAALAAEVGRLRAERAAPPKPTPPPMARLQDAILAKAKAAVDLAIGLAGASAFFLGLMKVAEDGGLLQIIARLIRPVMVRLFPHVPPDHPAMAAMILNLSANVLGLGNAATPLGLKAMQELDRLNPYKGTASDAMALFLTINTASVTLLPTGVIVLRSQLGSARAADILPTTLVATTLSTTVGVIVCLALARIWPTAEASTPADEVVAIGAVEGGEASEAYPAWVSGLALAALVAVLPLTVLYGDAVAPWIVPGLAMSLLGFGWWRGVPVYESFVKGAREGWDLTTRVIPYLVAILCAVGMLQASGALDVIVGFVSPFTAPLGMPGEALPMALLRPLSGSGAYGVLVATMSTPATGPDTYTGFLVSTINGSSETTFYVLAVYFGAIGVRRIRHTLPAALIADLAGLVGAVLACKAYFAWNGV